MSLSLLVRLWFAPANTAHGLLIATFLRIGQCVGARNHIYFVTFCFWSSVSINICRPAGFGLTYGPQTKLIILAGWAWIAP